MLNAKSSKKQNRLNKPAGKKNEGAEAFLSMSDNEAEMITRKKITFLSVGVEIWRRDTDDWHQNRD